MRFVKAMWLNSLRVKVLLAYVAGVALSIALIVLVAVAIVAVQGDILSGPDVADLTENLADMLRFDSEGVPVGFDNSSGLADSEDAFASWLFDSLKQEAAYRVLDASGNVALSSAAGGAFWPTSGAARRLQRGRFEFERQGVAMRGATESIEHNGRTWFVQCAVSERFLQFGYRAFALPFTGAGVTVFSLVLLFVFGVCAYVTLRYALRPLQEISESAAAISPHTLDARLQTHAVPTEIAPLVDSFNRVLERLERGYRIQQEFLATAAHELKTPLALIRAQIELTDDGEDRRALLNDVEHMTRQVQQLLLLAEASERRNYTFAVVDVQDVVKEAASYLQRMADAAGVHVLTPDNAAEAQWLADRGALFTLLKNLLENAIQHAPRGTDVQVDVSATALSVRDWGPGVSDEQLPKLFSRFWRGAHRRDHGAGLGLAICQEIALAHGWTLSAQMAEPGLRLCVSLPIDKDGVHRLPTDAALVERIERVLRH
jgi:signal transduction histidine kinase